MKKVYICSPCRGDYENNIQRAKEYSRAAVEKGIIPVTPHIYLTQFMDDNVPEERELALKIGSELVLGCSELWAFGIDHPSAGMAAEIELAKAHELAHVATPEDTEHGESWSAASEAIFKKYNELLGTMIPDEPEPILSPHQPGDGGILTMPLRDNVPEPPTDDWQPTTCPVCGAECWQTDTARRILALEPDVRTACTACALKGLGK